MKLKIFEILEGTSSNKKLVKYFAVFITLLIITNCIALVLETLDALHTDYYIYFEYFDILSIAIFSIEYFLRIWGCTVSPKYSHPIYGRLKFMVTPMALIDLIAILPFYLQFLITDLRFLRALRLLRIFRLLKLARYSKALHTFGRILASTKEELVITIILGMIAMFFASSLMYYVESPTQPEAFSSIPAAMWWAVATLTTVGYGDMYPITYWGKFLGGLVALLGIGMLALPAGIMGSAFVEEMEKQRGIFKICPHCGKTTSDRRKDDRRGEKKNDSKEQGENRRD